MPEWNDHFMKAKKPDGSVEFVCFYPNCLRQVFRSQDEVKHEAVKVHGPGVREWWKIKAFENMDEVFNITGITCYFIIKTFYYL